MSATGKALVLAAGVAALFILTTQGSVAPVLPDDATKPSTCSDTAVEPWVCIDGELFCPAAAVCPQSVPPTTMVDNLPTVTAPPTAPPPVDTQPASTAAPVEAAPATDAPPTTAAGTIPARDDGASAGVPQQEQPSSGAPTCVTGDWRDVRAGDNSWAMLADRLDVWTADLLEANGATRDTPLRVGGQVCRPTGPYDGQPAATQPPATQPAATIPPQAPTSAPVATTAAPAPTTPPTPAAPTATTRPRTTTTAPRTTPPPTTKPPRHEKPTYPRPPSTPAPGNDVCFAGGARIPCSTTTTIDPR